jgi:hypothetical protein
MESPPLGFPSVVKRRIKPRVTGVLSPYGEKVV